MDQVSGALPVGQEPEFWQHLADNIPQLAWVADEEGGIFWYNQRWYDYTGTELAQMQGWGWKAVHHPDHVERVVEGFRAAVASGTPWEDMFPLRSSAGEYRQFLSRANPIRGADGRVTHWFGTNTDVTQQVEAERELARSEERLRRATRAAGMFSWESDLRTGVTTWGEGAADILGVHEHELQQVSDGLFMVAPSDQERLNGEFAAALAERAPYHVAEFLSQDGRLWRAEGSISYGDGGVPERLFGVTREVTAERIEQRRDRFLLKLDNEMRSSSSPDQVKKSAAALLGSELGASRVLYAEVQSDPPTSFVSDEFRAPGIPSIAGTYRMPQPIFERYLKGDPLVTDDMLADPSMAAAREDPTIGALPFRAILDVPLLRNGQLKAVLAIHDVEVRRWTADEIELAVATAERTWESVERARAEQGLRDSEARARQAAEEIEAIYTAAPVGLTVLDRDLRYVRINDLLAEINGLPAEDHIGRTVREVVPDLAEQAEDAMRQVLAGEELRAIEISGTTASQPGVTRTWRENWLPFRDGTGEIVGVAISAEEVTGKIEAERALRNSEQRLNAILNNTTMGVFLMDQRQHCVFANAAAETLTGYSFAELSAKPLHDVIHNKKPDGSHYPLHECPIDRAFPERAQVQGEELFVAPDGSFYPVAFTASPLLDDEGTPVGTVIEARNIEGRRAREEALRKSEQRYRALFESMEQGFCTIKVDFDGDRPVDYRFTELNPAFTEQSGLTADVLHRSVREAVPGLEQTWFQRYGQVAWTGQSARFTEHAEPLGRWFDVYAFRIGDPTDHNVAILFSDVTAQRESQIALENSEARLRAVLEAAPVGLVFADACGRITGGNARVEEIIGKDVVHSEEVGAYKNDYVAFHEDGRQVESGEYPLARVISGELDRADLVCHVQRGDGSRTWVRYAATPVLDPDGTIIGGVVASIDIDREKLWSEGLEREVAKVVGEREAAQEALRQSQKLEAMGQLTGGVAHDFNNLLTPIIGSLDLLHRKQVGDARTQRLVDGALQSAERAKTLVQRLLAFARRQPLKATAVDVGDTVREMSELIASTSGPRVKVEVDLQPDLPPAHADANQLEMALLNLSVNARDAMPEGGSLLIRVELATEPPSEVGSGGASDFVVLTVSDTGEGMDAETRLRAIEPFFSTKGIGKGTGLGLSMVHGLAAQLGGALKIDSEVGQGTRIGLWLPVSKEAAAQSDQSAPVKGARSRGTVLLVDDEELVRSSTASMLSDLGFAVAEASSAEDALAQVAAGLHPDVLVTDQLMPGLNGTDLAVRLRRKLPTLPVLVVSGYADAESLTPGFPHLPKPFRHADLAASIAAITGAMTGDG